MRPISSRSWTAPSRRARRAARRAAGRAARSQARAQRDALLHPAGELVRVALGRIAEPDELEQLAIFPARRLRDAPRTLRPNSTFARRSCWGRGCTPGRPCPCRAGWAAPATCPCRRRRSGPSRAGRSRRPGRSAVVLPHPEGPSSERNSPCSSETPIPSSATTSPNCRRSCCSSTYAISERLRPARRGPSAPDDEQRQHRAQVIPKLISDTRRAGYAFVWLMYWM